MFLRIFQALKGKPNTRAYSEQLLSFPKVFNNIQLEALFQPFLHTLGPKQAAKPCAYTTTSLPRLPNHMLVQHHIILHFNTVLIQ